MVRQADDPFVCFGAKPNKGLSPRSSTLPEVGKGTRVRELEEGTQRSQLAKGDASGQSTPDSRSELSYEIESSSSEGRPVKLSQHSSWVVEFSLEIHASVSLHMHIGNAVLYNSSSCT